MQTLPGTSSAICGAPGARASAAWSTAGSGVQSIDDALGGIERLRPRLGDDQRDRLADMAHLADRQQRLRRKGERLAGLHVGFHRRTHRLQPVGARILAGQHRKHARHRPGRRRVDPLDPRMRVRRAQHHGVHHAVEAQIVQISALAGGEAGILPPPRRIAYDGKTCHKASLSLESGADSIP